MLHTTFWSAAGEASARGLMLLALVLAARILGQAGYGELGLIRTTIVMFASVGGMGLGLTANRFIAEYRAQDKTASGEVIGSSYVVALVSGTVVGLVVFLAAGYLAETVAGAPQLTTGFQLASVMLLAGALNGAQMGMLQGLHAYRALALCSLLQGLAALLLLAGGAYLYGLQGAITGLFLQSLVGVALFHFQILREARQQGIVIRWQPSGRIMPILVSFSLPIALMGVAVAPFKWVSETLVAKQLGFAELGIFHASMTISNIVIAAASAVNAPLISIMANDTAAAGSFRNQYINLFGSWYFYLLMAVPLLLFPGLAALPFGASYQTPQFSSLTVLLVVYCGLLLIYQGIMRLVALNDLMWFGFMTNIVEGVTLMAAFYLLLKYGVVGLGIAYVISYLVRMLVSMPFLMSRGILTRALLLEPVFVTTLVLVLVIAGVQLGRLE